MYWTVLCYHPYFVSTLFVDLLSLHLIIFLMFFILVNYSWRKLHNFADLKLPTLTLLHNGCRLYGYCCALFTGGQFSLITMVSTCIHQVSLSFLFPLHVPWQSPNSSITLRQSFTCRLPKCDWSIEISFSENLRSFKPMIHSKKIHVPFCVCLSGNLVGY